MKKIVVPAILGVIVLTAGVFASMPVQKASTVHGGILDDIHDLIQTNLIPAGNLNDGPVQLIIPADDGMACFEVNFTDDAGIADDPAVALTVGGFIVRIADPGNGATGVLEGCAPVAAGDVVAVDQQGADVDTGNTVNWGTVVILADEV